MAFILLEIPDAPSNVPNAEQTAQLMTMMMGDGLRTEKNGGQPLETIKVFKPSDELAAELQQKITAGGAQELPQLTEDEVDQLM